MQVNYFELNYNVIMLICVLSQPFMTTINVLIFQLDVALNFGNAVQYLKEFLKKINALNRQLKATPSCSSWAPSSSCDFRGWNHQVLLS